MRIAKTMLVAVVALAEAAAFQGAPPESKANVYIYRYKQFVGKAIRPSVFCDNKELARIQNGRYFVIALDLGKHTFRSNDKQSQIDIDLKAGQEYYIRAEIATGFWKGHGRIVLMQPEQGTAEVKQLKLIDGDMTKEGTIVASAALAQATSTPPISKSQPESGRKSRTLTNKDVMALKEVGLSDDIVIQQIMSSRTSFSVDADDLISLKKAGISDAVIRAMVNSSQMTNVGTASR